MSTKSFDLKRFNTESTTFQDPLSEFKSSPNPNREIRSRDRVLNLNRGNHPASLTEPGSIQVYKLCTDKLLVVHNENALEGNLRRQSHPIGHTEETQDRNRLGRPQQNIAYARN